MKIDILASVWWSICRVWSRARGPPQSCFSQNPVATVFGSQRVRCAFQVFEVVAE
jgi:hypothetical protein